jgi:anti-sigma B factor antagonist
VDELGAERARVDFDVTTGSSREVIVSIHGELDITAVGELQERVGPLLERGDAQLIVDVGQLRFADSSAIALWVRWAAAADSFELRHPQPLLRRVIDGMGLTEKLAVQP